MIKTCVQLTHLVCHTSTHLFRTNLSRTNPYYATGVTVSPDAGSPSAAALVSLLMPPRKDLRTNPKDYLPAGGTWPDDDLEEGRPDEAVIVQDISKKFRELLEPRGSEAKFARKAGISRQAVRNILRGETWIDLPTLYRIEKRLGHKLWIRDY